jgi:AcrR family transcriptional regulator
MPKGFSDEEKERIQKKLMEAGGELFSKHGIKKTNVIDLTRAVGIAKGSFYSFYNSKEELFLDVLEQVEKILQKQMVQILKDINKNPKKSIKDFIKFHFEMRENNPIIKLFREKDTIEYLTIKLGNLERFKKKLDTYDYILMFIKNWQAEGYLTHDDPTLLAGVLKALFTIGLQDEMRSYIGNNIYPGVILGINQVTYIYRGKKNLLKFEMVTNIFCRELTNSEKALNI